MYRQINFQKINILPNVACGRQIFLLVELLIENFKSLVAKINIDLRRLCNLIIDKESDKSFEKNDERTKTDG